jgi:hypothetical protein
MRQLTTRQQHRNVTRIFDNLALCRGQVHYHGQGRPSHDGRAGSRDDRAGRQPGRQPVPKWDYCLPCAKNTMQQTILRQHDVSLMIVGRWFTYLHGLPPNRLTSCHLIITPPRGPVNDESVGMGSSQVITAHCPQQLPWTVGSDEALTEAGTSAIYSSDVL